MQNETTIETKKYPTTADAEGFFYEDENNEIIGIETKVYENNGAKVHRIKFTDGNFAIVRELKGWEVINAGNKGEKNIGKMQAELAAMATKINDNSIDVTTLLDMKARDFNKIITASSLLNFI